MPAALLVAELLLLGGFAGFMAGLLGVGGGMLFSIRRSCSGLMKSSHVK